VLDPSRCGVELSKMRVARGISEAIPNISRNEPISNRQIGNTSEDHEP